MSTLAPIVYILFLSFLSLISSLPYTPFNHGILLNLTNYIYIDTTVDLSFKISISNNIPIMLNGRMIDNKLTYPPFEIINSDNILQMKTEYGSLYIIDNGVINFNITDVKNNIIVSSSNIEYIPSKSTKQINMCSLARVGDALDGSYIATYPNGINTTLSNCCELCNTENECTFYSYNNILSYCKLLYNVTSIKYDRGSQNPYAIDTTRCGGYTSSDSDNILLTLNYNNGRLYGSGGYMGSDLTSNSSTAYVRNGGIKVSYYYNTEGYNMLGVSPLDYSSVTPLFMYGASWNALDNQISWLVAGNQADFYISLATTPYAAQANYWALTGAPKILPKIAFGFAAGRWGWADSEYIESILAQFRNGSYPVDSFIMDYEWYTPLPDTSIPASGSPTFFDFGYNNVTFPDPVVQLKNYLTNFNVHFGGIRKPRVANSENVEFCAENGWLIEQWRNINFTSDNAKQFYAKNIAHFTRDGVSYWWNDEGESQYYTFHDWNLAEIESLAIFAPGRRFYSINRGFNPGMQRLGVAVWNGDTRSDWSTLVSTATNQLNWMMAGIGYYSTDIGGFAGDVDVEPTLLVRWYQVGAFLGVMRCHSQIERVAHFPFLYPQIYADAMKTTISLRYKLLPFLYSLAHQQYNELAPIFRPLFFEYPNDENTFELSSEWLVGDSLLVAPVLNPDNIVDLYLPEGIWFGYGTSDVAVGPISLQLTNVSLDTIPIYVRAGSIIPVSNVVQYIGQYPNGDLEIDIYDGSDCSFTFVEDDGISEDYIVSSDTGVRITTFIWTSASSTLQWKIVGSYQDINTFETFIANVYSKSTSYKRSSNRLDMTKDGTIVLI